MSQIKQILDHLDGVKEEPQDLADIIQKLYDYARESTPDAKRKLQELPKGDAGEKYFY